MSDNDKIVLLMVIAAVILIASYWLRNGAYPMP